MPFEIRYPNGDKVPFETLNAEAANLWSIGIARDKVQYVSPLSNVVGPVYDECNSWEEMIGNAIMHPQVIDAHPMFPSWPHVRETLFNSQLDGAEVWEKGWFQIDEIIKSSITWLQPYNELIDLWESKGYVPIRIK